MQTFGLHSPPPQKNAHCGNCTHYIAIYYISLEKKISFPPYNITLLYAHIPKKETFLPPQKMHIAELHTLHCYILHITRKENFLPPKQLSTRNIATYSLEKKLSPPQKKCTLRKLHTLHCYILHITRKENFLPPMLFVHITLLYSTYSKKKKLSSPPKKMHIAEIAHITLLYTTYH